MKTTVRIICAMLALSAVLALGACRKQQTDVPEGYKLAGAAESGADDRSEAKDYYLYIPQAWTVDINNTATSAFVSASDPASVSVMTWTVSVTDATPAECWDTSVTDFKKVYADFKEESREDVKLDGVDALSVTFTGSLGEGDEANAFRFCQVLAVKDTLVYVLTYTNLESRFDEHSQDFADIVSYFKFK